MNKHPWLTIAAVALLAAALASAITAQITGNVIRQNNNFNGVYQLYTKGELDSKFTALDNKLAAINRGLTAIQNRIDQVELSSCTQWVTVPENVNGSQEIRVARLRMQVRIASLTSSSVILSFDGFNSTSLTERQTYQPYGNEINVTVLDISKRNIPGTYGSVDLLFKGC